MGPGLVGGRNGVVGGPDTARDGRGRQVAKRSCHLRWSLHVAGGHVDGVHDNSCHIAVEGATTAGGAVSGATAQQAPSVVDRPKARAGA